MNGQGKLQTAESVKAYRRSMAFIAVLWTGEIEQQAKRLYGLNLSQNRDGCAKWKRRSRTGQVDEGQIHLVVIVS